jgi:hypothetical protein
MSEVPLYDAKRQWKALEKSTGKKFYLPGLGAAEQFQKPLILLWQKPLMLRLRPNLLQLALASSERNVDFPK